MKRPSLFYPCYFLLLAGILICSCRKNDDGGSGPAPEPPEDSSYLVTAIRINGLPKDSLVYNERQQVKERWDYNPSYRMWQNYVTFTYNANGYVKTARYYHENDNTTKSLSQQDSIIWETGRVITYTTKYREYGTEISGYDTTSLQINGDLQLSMSGIKDTAYLDFIKWLLYDEFSYTGNDLQQFHYLNHVIPNRAPAVKREYTFTMQYGQQRNALYPQLSRNPVLARLVTAYRNPEEGIGYPYLVSLHHITAVTYQLNGQAVPVTVNTKMKNERYPESIQLSGLGEEISYRYKVVKNK
ncbi:hypothetical protein [Chitinophaga solisilvae]|uniref:hypothetical protein n=1 Tax=Chitinophaga solisilvae TaxID=1233460 RepID=UPI001367B33C|nr:hypothetical protein [Chitinophaga solisilvae]